MRGSLSNQRAPPKCPFLAGFQHTSNLVTSILFTLIILSDAVLYIICWCIAVSITIIIEQTGSLYVGGNKTINVSDVQKDAHQINKITKI